MAPNRDSSHNFNRDNKNLTQEQSKLSMERTISDISSELMTQEQELLPPISEVEDATCECCGMCEEFTAQYVKKVRDKFSGKMICGLCSEAVKEEMEKNGGKSEAALHAHLTACSKFNRIGRAYPVLCQAEEMRLIFRKNRAKLLSLRDKGGTKIYRSSSCIPSITKDFATRY